MLMKFLRRLYENHEFRREYTKAGQKTWKVRDGYRYSALLMDKLLYAYEYHHNAFEWIVSVVSSLIGALLGLLLCLLLR